MHKALASLTLVAALALAPISLHADSIMTGQFSIEGTVTNTVTDGTTELVFDGPTLKTGTGTQTGSFSSLLTDGEAFSAGSSTIVPYNPYVPNSAFFTIGSLSVVVESLMEDTEIINGQTVLGFSGMANLSAAGFADTQAIFTFSTQDSGPVTFSATAIADAPPAVPEPSSLVLFGTGAFGLAGVLSRKLRRATLN
jgi:PEP-CTERM motif